MNKLEVSGKKYPIICNVDLMGKSDNKENFKEYYSAGVWALFGQEKDGEKYFCLQVGQTKNIGEEININIKYLDKIFIQDKYFINQFEKQVFSYKRYPTMREIIYNQINNKYKNLIFVLIGISDCVDQRRKIEKNFAEETRSIYWRNGGSFKRGEDLDLSTINLGVKII